MIYTVTFNPALDYVIAVDHFAPGKVYLPCGLSGVAGWLRQAGCLTR